MNDKLVKRLWECASGECFNCSQHTPTTNASVCQKELMKQAADAIEELQKAVLRLEDERGILDELPMVDQSTPCDTCAHKGNVDFDYCHICNNEANMYKPQPPKEE